MVKSKRTKLFTIKCPNCLSEFKVANPDSWICNNCYERNAPALGLKPKTGAQKRKKE
jgi:hypothetical protein